MTLISRAALLRTGLLLAALMLLSACSDKNEPAKATPSETAVPAAKADDDHEGEAHGEEGDEHAEAEGPPTIRMDEAALAAAGIKVAPVVASALSEELRAPGEVVDSAYGTTLITPRVDALVVRRHAKLGDEVQARRAAGDAVERRGCAGARHAAHRRAGLEAGAGLAATPCPVGAIPKRKWLSNRPAPPRRPMASRGRPRARPTGSSRSARRTPGESRRTRSSSASGSSRGAPCSAWWTSPWCGWMPSCRRKVPAASRSAAPANRTRRYVRMTGTVLQRAHRTSEGTRNALVRVEVNNEGDRLHGGDYVEVYLDAGESSGATAASPALAVPTGALVQLEGDTVVFRQAPDGTLAPVAVRTGNVIGDQTVVLEGPGRGRSHRGRRRVRAQGADPQVTAGEGHAH
jgi:cobalt-zinc-cadmium efflux system membrane fusion protein